MRIDMARTHCTVCATADQLLRDGERAAKQGRADDFMAARNRVLQLIGLNRACDQVSMIDVLEYLDMYMDQCEGARISDAYLAEYREGIFASDAR